MMVIKMEYEFVKDDIATAYIGSYNLRFLVMYANLFMRYGVKAWDLMLKDNFLAFIKE